MAISTVRIEVPKAQSVTATDDTLTVSLGDGRSISVPLSWYPRLVHATPEERAHWELIGDGQGFRWELLDEDISVEGLLAGRPSGESRRSLRRWLAAKKAGHSVALHELRRAETEHCSEE